MKRLNLNSPAPNTFSGVTTISPQGTKIAFTTDPVNGNSSWVNTRDVYVINVDDDAVDIDEPRLLTDYTDAMTGALTFSPDGNSVLYGQRAAENDYALNL